MRDQRERQRHRQREKWAPCREPDVGLDPGSPGSGPGLQAALNRCTTGAARFYLFMRDTQREAETQAEGEVGSMQEAQHGTRSWVPRIMPWVEGGAKPLSHCGCPG